VGAMAEAARAQGAPGASAAWKRWPRLRLPCARCAWEGAWWLLHVLVLRVAGGLWQQILFAGVLCGVLALGTLAHKLPAALQLQVPWLSSLLTLPPSLPANRMRRSPASAARRPRLVLLLAGRRRGSEKCL